MKVLTSFHNTENEFEGFLNDFKKVDLIYVRCRLTNDYRLCSDIEVRPTSSVR